MEELVEHKKTNITNFMNLFIYYHDKIFRYSESYISEKKENFKSQYKAKIKDNFNEAKNIINKYSDEPFFSLPFAKVLIIDIYYSYGSILLLEKKDFAKIK